MIEQGVYQDPESSIKKVVNSVLKNH
ncbi:uncharacterized protein METZ01_LOCUS283560, partial [marine metagenome]